MRKPRAFDPLSFIPSPEAIQQRLNDTELTAERLRILLRVSQEIKEAGNIQCKSPMSQGAPYAS